MLVQHRPLDFGYEGLSAASPFLEPDHVDLATSSPRPSETPGSDEGRDAVVNEQRPWLYAIAIDPHDLGFSSRQPLPARTAKRWPEVDATQDHRLVPRSAPVSVHQHPFPSLKGEESLIDPHFPRQHRALEFGEAREEEHQPPPGTPAVLDETPRTSKPSQVGVPEHQGHE